MKRSATTRRCLARVHGKRLEHRCRCRSSLGRGPEWTRVVEMKMEMERMDSLRRRRRAGVLTGGARWSRTIFETRAGEPFLGRTRAGRADHGARGAGALRLLIPLAVASLVPFPASAAPAMTVAEFLGKVDILKSKGIGAMWAPEARQLRDEVETTSDAYRAGLAAQKASGRRPESCPPPKGKSKLSARDFVGELRAIPRAQQGISFKSAFAALMRKRYPCT